MKLAVRPYAYPRGDLLPGAWFVIVVVACFSLWWLLPRAHYETHEFERTGRIYRLLGVLFFRRFAPNGDLANRWERRADPNFRVVGGRRSATEFVARTEQSERGHLVLLALGVVSAADVPRLTFRRNRPAMYREALTCAIRAAPGSCEELC